MPFAEFPDFESCILHMKTKEGYSDEVANKVCGMLKERHERNNSSEKSFRELRFNFSTGKFQELEGGLLIRDIKLLSSGIWTDSNVKTPLFYPPEVLQRYYSNWIDNAVWSRHNGGVPRDITDKIGETRNQRYENEAIMGDIFLHGKTSKSRDTIELVKAGLANFVSVEHGGKEMWNVGMKRYEAQDLTFGGVAVVNRGACAVCTIQNESIIPESHSLSAEAEIMELKELETKLTETERQLAESTKTVIALQGTVKELQEASVVKGTKIGEFEKQLSESKTGIAEMTRQLGEAVKRIEKIEKTPAPHTMVIGDTGFQHGAVPVYNPIRIKDGEIFMESI